MDIGSAGFGAALVAAIGLIKEIIAWRRRAAEKRDRLGVEVALREQARIHSRLNELVARTSFQRAVIYRVSNGGAIPQPGKTLYSSVFAESYPEKPLRAMRHRWQDQVLDGPYLQTLAGLMVSRHMTIPRERMQGIMLDVAERQLAVSRLFVVHIPKSRDALFYLSLDSATDQEETAEERDAVRQTVASIASSLKGFE